MKVKMNRTVKGSPDGSRVFVYLEGEIYDTQEENFSFSLAEALLRHNWAKKVGGRPKKKKPTPSEHKSE